MTALPDNPQASESVQGDTEQFDNDTSQASGGAQAASEGSEQKRCGGSGRIMTHRDDPRGPQANRLPDSTAGGSVFSCPGCPDCQAASGEGGVCLELTRAEAEAIDEALAIMETEDRMPEHESAFNKVRTALSPRP